MKIKILNFVVLSALAMMQTLSAKANSVSYTSSVSSGSPTGLAFSQFNLSLGTLESMTFELSGAFSSTFTITNTSTTYLTGSSARRNSDISLGSSAVAQALDAQNPNGAGNSWLSWLSSPLNLSGLVGGGHLSATRNNTIDPGVATYTDNTTLAYFEGTGTTFIDFSTINGFTMTLNGGTSYSSSSTMNVALTGIVTYNYILTPTPAPEPSTLVLSAVGGVGLFLLLRRRK